jgi:hypothetical protein
MLEPFYQSRLIKTMHNYGAFDELGIKYEKIISSATLVSMKFIAKNHRCLSSSDSDSKAILELEKG